MAALPKPTSLPTGRCAALPRPLTSLVGRVTEIARGRALLADPAVQLVTLTGPGGVGKTRLAIAIAEAVAGYRAAGDAIHTAYEIDKLGVIARRQGNTARARTLHEEALAIQRAAGDRHGAAKTLQGLARLASLDGDLEAASRLLLEARLFHRERGARSSEAYALNNLGIIAADRGDLTQATDWCEEALVLFREIDEQTGSRWRSTTWRRSFGKAATRRARSPCCARAS